MPYSKIYLPLLIFMSLLAILLGGCAIRDFPDRTTEPGQRQEPVRRPEAPSRPISGIPAPWQTLAGRLAGQGLPQDKLAVFFNSPGLSFTSAPMETKLRELFGIYYKSDLTKAVQEKLWCLGYDVLIDGRLGSGTRNQVKAFQKAWGLPQTGAVTEALSAKLSEVLAQDRQRDLKDYRPPAAAKPSRTATHQQFTNPQALVKIKGYYLEDKNLFGGMERAFQVPGPLVASIMWIETGYGGYFGKNKAAVVLASMAASAEYRLIAPAVSDLEGDAEARAFLAETADKRGAWARDELAALLKYAWSNGLDPMTFPGSIYGAIGYGQFMPSNVAKYAVDGDGDGRIDLFNKADAIFSIGRYLRENGWQGNMGDEEKRRAVIMRYNRSGVYVNTVLYVADYIGY